MKTALVHMFENIVYHKVLCIISKILCFVAKTEINRSLKNPELEEVYFGERTEAFATIFGNFLLRIF